MKTFDDYLSAQGSNELSGILNDLTDVAISFSDALNGMRAGYAGTKNIHGEEQLKMDVLANDIFVDRLIKNISVAMIASEEMEEPIVPANKEGKYSVAFDPLDGSSLVDANLAVGSIIGVYEGKGFLGRKGSEQVAAVMIIYGPRLSFLITTGQGVDEFIFESGKKGAGHEFVWSAHQLQLEATGKIFAPGNLRACKSEKWYADLLDYWVKNGYTLRYSGGMAPDVNQIIKKGGGIFTYPGYKEQPQGKLRLLYECAPIAFLVEQAGGEAISQSGRILDMPIEDLHQRTPVFLGSSKEVELVRQYSNR